jgi:membrane peptidoglycan carboxypeptidase
MWCIRICSMRQPTLGHPDKSNNTRKALRTLLPVSLALVLGLVAYTFWNLPRIDSLPDHLNLPSVRITDRSGRLLYDLLPVQGGRHMLISFDKIPQCIKEATLAVEDKNFYHNPGIDPEGILRALWINLRGGQTIAGGSTITQQVARSLLLSQSERYELSLRRKLREAVLGWESRAVPSA